MSPKLLIVGGTGFIGHHIAKKAICNGFEVFSISKNSPAPDRLINGVKYFYIDLLDIKKLKDFFCNREIDFIVNTVGYIDHTLFKNGGDYIFENHFIASKNLINSINREYLKCFIHLGSSDEYGDNPSPQSEDQRESPISPYSFAKVSTCHLLQMLERTEKFPAIILRLFLVYGPSQNEKRLLPNLIKNCIKDNIIPVTLGEQIRDFCYVEDIVRAIFLIFKKRNIQGNIINIASGNPIQLKELIALVRNLIGKGEPLFGALDYRKKESMSLYADISKAKRLLMWEPKYSLEDGLIETINWFKNNV